MEINKDPTALFKLSYGLYVVTCHDGKKDNGLIVNTVVQLTSDPVRVAVTVNKQNYSHDVIRQTGAMNVNCLDVSAPFSVFQTFGFQSGRSADKFAGTPQKRTENGLRVLPDHINAVLSLVVESYVDVGTHGMFICRVVESHSLSGLDSMTYDYYHKNVKPSQPPKAKKGYVCKICGWVYEGDALPEDLVCPICKHGKADFEKIP